MTGIRFDRCRVMLAAMALVNVCILAGCSLSRNTTDLQMDNQMTKHAGGMFEVALAPQGEQDAAEGTTMGRMSIDKTFHGDLEATSEGEMLSARTTIAGSAGYVAIERVIGTLHGKRGSFVLQHFATMTRGVPHQVVEVVPDSGSGELAGITGSMTINIVDGKHFYEFEYALDEVARDGSPSK
jgi:Protein of unknown function (DUF3224)